jgi:hypothetical protein
VLLHRSETAGIPARESWLNRPLSGRSCALGWIAATVIFLVVVRLCGGPSEGDVAEGGYSTWAVAHGYLACAYSPAAAFHFPSIARPGPFIAPLWPMLSGVFAAVFRIGHSVPFPSQKALGPHCSTALVAMYHWSVRSNAVKQTVQLGYLSWVALMAGVVALLRACGRGRCGWEPAVLALLACIPAVWASIVQFTHPQDLLAMGLALGSLACARRGWWVWAGILVGLATTSQQFALLVAAPLFVVVPAPRRVRFAGAVIGAAALVIVPFVAITSGRALRAVVLGSGNTSSFGGTVLWELHLHGAMLVGLSRILPIALSVLLAWWALRQLGPDVLEPVPLVSLVATSLTLRLVFEQNLFGYYLMALVVCLVILDAVQGRLRGRLLAWLAVVTLAFPYVPWGFFSNSVGWGLQEREFLPFVFIGIALTLIVVDAVRGRVRWYLVVWLVVMAVAFGRLPWANPSLRHAFPTWFWQLTLVPTGLAMAVGPLVSAVRNRVRSPDLCPVDAVGPSGQSVRELQSSIR